MSTPILLYELGYFLPAPERPIKNKHSVDLQFSSHWKRTPKSAQAGKILTWFGWSSLILHLSENIKCFIILTIFHACWDHDTPQNNILVRYLIKQLPDDPNITHLIKSKKGCWNCHFWLKTLFDHSSMHHLNHWIPAEWVNGSYYVVHCHMIWPVPILRTSSWRSQKQSLVEIGDFKLPRYYTLSLSIKFNWVFVVHWFCGWSSIDRGTYRINFSFGTYDKQVASTSRKAQHISAGKKDKYQIFILWIIDWGFFLKGKPAESRTEETRIAFEQFLQLLGVLQLR